MKKDEDKAPREMGIVSLGISLVIVGIILLLSVFTSIDPITLFIPAGPVILAVIIAELSWFNYKERKEQEEIIRAEREARGLKYEEKETGIEQVLLILFIIIVTLIILGLLFFKSDKGQNFIMDLGTADYGFDREHSEKIDNIKIIIVDAKNIPDMNIIISDIEEIEYEENKVIRAKTNGEAKKIFAENGISFTKAGERLYISQRFYNEELCKNNELNLKIPSDKNIKLVSGQNLTMDIRDLKNDIKVEEFESIGIQINEDLSTTIDATTFENKNLKGNVIWTIDNKEYNEFIRSRGTVKTKEGTHKIEIMEVKEELDVQMR